MRRDGSSYENCTREWGPGIGWRGRAKGVAECGGRGRSAEAGEWHGTRKEPHALAGSVKRIRGWLVRGTWCGAPAHVQYEERLSRAHVHCELRHHRLQLDKRHATVRAGRQLEWFLPGRM